ncbi:MAG: hypothetical protein JWO06_998 [Bacteroidota bacterium]|nr:hypothetical protein [Bacteroidota bacterium]
MRRKYLVAFTQLLAWAAFIFLPVLLFNTSYHDMLEGPHGPDHPFPAPPPLLDIPRIIFSTLLVGYYYINFYILIPRLFVKRQYLLYFVCILIVYIILVPLPFIIRFRDFHIPPFVYNFPTLVSFFVVTLIGISIRMISEWSRAGESMKEAESERIKNELSYLKSQVNPHFLFNVLNNIYTLATIKSDRTPDAIMSLSSLMRYIVTEADREYVPLEREFQHIENFIELQKMRLSETTTTHFHFYNADNDYQIAPLLLLPFVENAFKYGVSTHQPSEIDISATVENKILNFKVMNSKVSSNKETIMTNTGIGIANVKRRLELTYRDKYDLKIDETESTFLVDLKLQLT